MEERPLAPHRVEDEMFTTDQCRLLRHNFPYMSPASSQETEATEKPPVIPISSMHPSLRSTGMR